MSFPAEFKWGTATSAYQVEGAVDEDGRGASIWDSFAHTPGKIGDGSNGDVAVDHYHRYREDVRLMSNLGVNAYRFSVSWPRIFPTGRGKPNPMGIDFYRRLVDELLGNGIEPYVTLYHWDLPRALHDAGGWESRDTALAFADYAAYVVDQLGDRVKHFFTINEFTTFVEYGYRTGMLAPGLTLAPARLNQVRHHAVLAHGLAVQAIRARARSVFVGPAEQLLIAVPVIENAEHIRAAELATREINAGYLTVMLEGRYTDAFLAAQGENAPKFTPEDLKIISSPVDFVGINVYGARHYVRALDEAPGYAIVPFQRNSHPSARWPGADFSLELSPEAMYWGPRHLAKIWNVHNIYITENGAPFAHKLGADGVDYDTDRIMFLRSYLTQLQRAVEEGVPVRGYFHWSLLDNFEWSAGFKPRFGLYYVDHETNERRPKLSAQFYREVIAQNRPA